jgi:hypothetical protein
VRLSILVLWWRDHALDGPVDAGNYKAATEEFEMVVEATTRFWEAPQDLCIVELGVPWHIGSSFAQYLGDAAIYRLK